MKIQPKLYKKESFQLLVKSKKLPSPRLTAVATTAKIARMEPQKTGGSTKRLKSMILVFL